MYIKIGSYDKITNKIEREATAQGYVFKDEEAYIKGCGVCYIPELSDEKYTREDFLRIANGNIDIANMLFEMVDWQSPETLYDELEMEGEW